MSTYRIVVKNGAGTTIGELDRFSDLSFNRRLNREGACSFSIPVTDEKSTLSFLQMGINSVYIYRENQIVWGGYMESFEGVLQEGATEMKIICKGFFNLLKYRYSDKLKIYTDTDASAIMWDQIYLSKQKTNGTLPITQGTLQSSVNRDRTYEYKNLYEMCVEFSDVKRGFDFEFTPLGVFNTYYPYKGADKSQIHTLQLGKNIESIRYISTVDSICNQAIVLGGYFGEAMKSSTRDDANLQASYGLRQKVITYKDVENTTLLDDRGDDELLQYGAPRREYDVAQSMGSDPDFINLEVGDFVKIVADKGFIQLNDTVRINEISVSVGDGGLEQVSYSFLYT